jgi:hypothetical protein
MSRVMEARCNTPEKSHYFVSLRKTLHDVSKIGTERQTRRYNSLRLLFEFFFSWNALEIPTGMRAHFSL